ncbi:hypothetical protein ACIA58_25815 [Kribbella sp. NPDC051586]|uniref:hypothetical protein n=1 Tax=Kribbella sp. NPDC051586 TaxID=3364118 RepID=UPI0037ADEE5F
MMTVGGVDTYYDYDEGQWKYRRLGGGPVRATVACPEPRPSDVDDQTKPTRRRTPHTSARATAETVGR